ncbi:MULTISPECIES: LuxR C-terminal-related transcriptional regulator [Sphaerisporangium]|uniref:LuxR C-terminal-related transcriptional regulator n=1 Tax=Sphaerisporangium rhizosphaerae TaxID=2269375 RepID=A0ABW2PE36_9ACTN
MLSALGLSTRDEAIYRTMLDRPDFGVADIAAHLGLTTDDVREALDTLIDLALVRSTIEDGTVRAVRPQAGLTALLARVEAELGTRQQQLEGARASIASIAAAYAEQEQSEEGRRLNGLDTVRDRLAELSHSAVVECVSLSPGGAQNPSTIESEKPLNQIALGRGVKIRTVYLDSIRNDPVTLSYARSMVALGEQCRTVPNLPMRLVIVDREIALVPLDPIDPTRGALELRSRGVVTGLYALFEQVWSSGTPITEPPARNEHGLTPQEHSLLRLLADGHTDESAARNLAISLRSVQRMMNALTERLNAVSRFQAGTEASRRGWV